LSFQNLFYFWRGSLEAGKGHRYRLARIVWGMAESGYESV
jgi:hypothetical protein